MSYDNVVTHYYYICTINDRYCHRYEQENTLKVIKGRVHTVDMSDNPCPLVVSLFSLYLMSELWLCAERVIIVVHEIVVI